MDNPENWVIVLPFGGLLVSIAVLVYKRPGTVEFLVCAILAVGCLIQTAILLFWILAKSYGI